MNNTTHNGWTNYATWRVMLEIFDGMTPSDVTGRKLPEVSDFKDALQEWAEEIIINDTPDGGLARDYALAFLSDVNWWEIANQMLVDYAEEEETE